MTVAKDCPSVGRRRRYLESEGLPETEYWVTWHTKYAEVNDLTELRYYSIHYFIRNINYVNMFNLNTILFLIYKLFFLDLTVVLREMERRIIFPGRKF